MTLRRWKAIPVTMLVVGQRVMTPDNRMRKVKQLEEVLPKVLTETRVFWEDGGEERFCNNKQLLAEEKG